MNDEPSDGADFRSYGARAGITALNLIAPGLGLLRVGNWRAGVILLVAPPALMALTTLAMGHLPISSYRQIIIALAVLVSAAGAIYVASGVMTWRQSKRFTPTRGWSRWYGLTAVATFVLILSPFETHLLHRFYKPFFAPSESMAPTIGKGDKFLANMMFRGPFKRGDIIIFTARDGVRISRIAGIAGDSIAIQAGVPILNGKAALQTAHGRTEFVRSDGPESGAVLNEQLPGEASPHRIYDIGPSPYDDMPEVVVPSGHLFVLGDNRDRSADSRVPPEFDGVGMVPWTSVIGRPMYIHWSSDHAKVGTRLDQ